MRPGFEETAFLDVLPPELRRDELFPVAFHLLRGYRPVPRLLPDAQSRAFRASMFGCEMPGKAISRCFPG